MTDSAAICEQIPVLSRLTKEKSEDNDSALLQRHESNRRDEILKSNFAKINIREQILGINSEYDLALK